MAGISTDPNGSRTLQFVGADKKRRSVRLGKVTKKQAEATKPATLVTIHRVSHDLVTHFKADADLRGITVEAAERFKNYYQGKGLAPATTYRRLKMAKVLFAHALRLKLVAENPFADVRGKNVNPAGGTNSPSATRRTCYAWPTCRGGSSSLWLDWPDCGRRRKNSR